MESESCDPPEKMASKSFADATKEDDNDFGSVKPVFIIEKDILGDQPVSKANFIDHREVYVALSEQIPQRTIKGLQRVYGLWRIYLDNETDKEELISKGLTMRDKKVPIYTRNPNVTQREHPNSLRIRVQNVPLSASDGQILRALEVENCKIITHFRERLRFNNMLTNCQTGDRIVICEPASEPLPRTLMIGKYKATIIHRGQLPNRQNVTCNKCLEKGHYGQDCKKGWKCRSCGGFGHKQDACPKDKFSDESYGTGNDSNSEDDDNDKDSHTDEDDDKQDETINQSADNRQSASEQAEDQPAQSISGSEKVDNPQSQDKARKKAKPKKKAQQEKTGEEDIRRFFSEANRTPRKEVATNSSVEKSPVTPTETLHDKESNGANKKQKI